MKKAFDNKLIFGYLALVCVVMFPLLRGHEMDVDMIWKCCMGLMQLGTLCTSILMFRRLFEGKASKYPVFWGVLLYMSCPYRIYVCYDLADMAQAVVWAVIPLYIWAVLGIVRNRKMNQKNMLNLGVATLSLAGIGYTNLMQMLVVAGFTLLVALCAREWFLLVSLTAGSALTLPHLLGLYRYLFRGAYEELGLPVNSIMGSGYVLGEFFSSFVYREGHPGVGLGMMLCLLTGLWLMFVKGEKLTGDKPLSFSRKACVWFVALAAVLLLMSLQAFPWEYVQRLGQWALKLVSLLETPGIFFGMAQIALCVPGAWAMERLEQQEDKGLFAGLAVLVFIACLGGCIGYRYPAVGII
ncbi:MAG: hypothetical protein NC092_06920 [Butyrivibrio sp.]|nr:hypothetical protein [Muribaculum sp.]MCM1552407.1 hypothetical protein [Butyrivibrio sp.]